MNAKRALILLALLSATAASAAQEGLVAHYTFDEGAGRVLKDLSGKGNHGKILGGAKWAGLKQGHALSFDGADDYVDIGNGRSLNVASQCTISVWCRPVKRQGGLLTCTTGTSWPDERLVLCFSSSGKLMWSLADGKKFLSGRNTAPEIEGWQHLALTFDGFRVTLYRNGESLASRVQRFFMPDLARQPFVIGNHLCSTNPEVRKILLKGLQAEFDKGFDWVQLGQEDGFRKCECETCSALDEYTNHHQLRAGYSRWYEQLRDYPCERLLLLHKWLADEAKKSHPDKTVHLLVYGPTIAPSNNFDKWPDNVVAEMCSQTPRAIADWKGKVRGMTGYVYWFDISLARGLGVHATQREVATTIRYLHEQGFVGLYQFPQANWGLSGPAFYILGKLMGDPYLDYTALLEDYCLGIFGRRAGKTMVDFYLLLDDMPEVTTHIWQPTHLAKLESILRKAESQATNAREKKWLRLTRDHFEYSKFFSRMLTAYRAYLENPRDATWTRLKKATTAFEDLRDRILHYPDEHTRAYFPGHDRFCNFLTGKYLDYYGNWKAKRKEVLAKPIRGTGFGWRAGGVDYPVSLDFTEPPHKRKVTPK